MGIARRICNTKAKLAIKQNIYGGLYEYQK